MNGIAVKFAKVANAGAGRRVVIALIELTIGVTTFSYLYNQT
jgi:hypothetical protein